MDPSLRYASFRMTKKSHIHLRLIVAGEIINESTDYFTEAEHPEAGNRALHGLYNVWHQGPR